MVTSADVILLAGGLKMPTQNKQQALEKISSLMQAHGISVDDITAEVSPTSTPISKQAQKATSTLKTAMAYAGSNFIYVGFCALVAMFWPDLNSVQQVVLALGGGMVFLGLGVMATYSQRHSKTAIPFFVLAAAFQPIGLFVVALEFLPFPADKAFVAFVIFTVMALQMGLMFKTLQRPLMLLLLIVFGFAAYQALFVWLNISSGLGAAVLGSAGLMVTYRLAKSVNEGFLGFLFFVFAGYLAYGVFQMLAGMPPYDALLIGVAAGVIYVSVLARSRALLVAGVLFVIGSLFYYTDEYFANVIGWPVALMCIGLLLHWLSRHAVRLGGSFTRSHEDTT